MAIMPIGVSNYRKLREFRGENHECYTFIDKSLFIKEIIYDGAEVIVITRPRRFGKTLNLSMLQYFLSNEVDGHPTKPLFDDLKITKDKVLCDTFQGQYPVIFITFKDVGESTFDGVLNAIREQIKRAFNDHRYLLQSDKLSASDKYLFQQLINKTAPIDELKVAIFNLAKFLFAEFDKRPYLLIDEYDTPIQAAFLAGHYEATIDFFKSLFGNSLKDHNNITKAVLTGITRVSKESLFSDVNNLEMYSVLHKQYSQYFGFTQDETEELINKTNMSFHAYKAKEWYNGYVFGDTTIYNPWSILQFIKNEGKLLPYWVNTGGYELIKDLIINSESDVKEELEKLLSGGTVERSIDEYIVFPELKYNRAGTIWSLLLMAGYLKQTSSFIIDDEIIYYLQIPNKEISSIYKKIIRVWLTGSQDFKWQQEFLKDLINGKFKEFETKLKRVLWNIASTKNVPNDDKELFYHGLMLGLVTGLIDSYEIKSEKESGSGVYDICLVPRHINNCGIVIELKSINKSEPEQLNTAAEAAMNQINRQQYVTELLERGVKQIYKIAIAFSGKELKLLSEHHVC